MGRSASRATKLPTAEQRFALLHERCLRPITAYCRRRVQAQHVDDVVADVLAIAWRRIDAVPDDDAALLWLYRVAYRTIGHHWRSAARRRRLGARLAEVGGSVADGPEERVVQREQVRRVLDAASNLGKRDAEVLRLVSWERLSIVESAAVLDITPNAVKQRLHRARKNLTKELNRLRPPVIASPAAPEGGAM